MISLSTLPPGLLQWLQGPGVGRLVLVVNLLLVLGLTWLLAQMTWQLLLPVAPAPTLLPASTVAVAPAQTVARGGEVARLHLFGEAVVGAETPVEEVPRDAPDTRLRLTLRGLFAARDPDQALAIVADPGGEEKAYRVGDPLPGGAELREIHADRVILSRAGRYETLRLPQEEPIDGMGRAPLASPAGDAGEPAMDPGLLLQQHRETLRNNPQALVNLVRPMPVQEDGRLVGFRLMPGTERNFLPQLGLRPGDIVTAINGMALDNPASGLQALQALQNETSVSLEIRRGQQAMTLNFEVPQ